MTPLPPFIRGIRDKLVVSFAALVAAIAIFVFLYFPARLEHQALRATIAKADVIREMTAYSVASGLLFNDRAAVSEALVGAAVEDVSYLVVWDDSGRVVASRGAVTVPPGSPLPRPGGEISGDGRNYVSTTTVRSGARRVGTLSVGLSLAPLRAEAALSRRIGALVGTLIFIFGLVVIYVISAYLTRPLTALSLTVNRIAGGDLTLRAAEAHDEEVAQLVRAFNRMIDTLVGTQAELAAMNAELESRVSERTAALTLAIEEQRRSQDALVLSEGEARRARALLEALIDVAPQAIVATDTQGRVTRWNHGAERMFGWTASEVLGRPVPYLPAIQSGVSSDGGPEFSTTARANAQEVTRRRKDGTSFSALLGVGIMRDEDQRPIGFIDFFTDLTERKRLEEQLRQSQKMDALGRLAGGIAHDFNNILTIITTCSELMLMRPRSAKDRAQLQEISGAAARAAALTRQLLTFTRQQVVQVRALDVATVVGDFVPMLRRVLPANIQFTTDFDAAHGQVMADPTQLEQVVMNLVVNAADAMPQGGALRMETRHVDVREAIVNGDPMPAGPYTVLSIEDTGTGIDDETIAKMFDPFFTTKGVGKGSGLGLATTYAIVAGLGGTIRVRSTPGRGATFRVYLPEASASAPASAAITVPQPAGTVAQRSGTILLVEDELPVRRVVRGLLQRAGFEVWEATNGEEALAIAQERGDQLNAVVTDMMMPGMSGRTLASELAVLSPKLGVVFISGYAELTAEGELVSDARHVFLQKPFTNAQLVAAIERVCP